MQTYVASTSISKGEKWRWRAPALARVAIAALARQQVFSGRASDRSEEMRRLAKMSVSAVKKRGGRTVSAEIISIESLK